MTGGFPPAGEGFEWDRVEYSAVAESLNAPSFPGGRFLVEIDDGDELHLGGESVVRMVAAWPSSTSGAM